MSFVDVFFMENFQERVTRLSLVEREVGIYDIQFELSSLRCRNLILLKSLPESQLERDNLLNLSILLRRGKESNNDSCSNSE